jgi:hypothetical protein
MEDRERAGTELAPEEIAAGLRAAGVIDSRLTECRRLSGGTVSRVAALSRPGGPSELVVKINAPAVVRAEAQFLETYGASPLLPALRHLDPACRFLVCEFRPGVQVRYGEHRADVAGAMLTLVRDLLSRYVPFDAAGDGAERERPGQRAAQQGAQRMGQPGAPGKRVGWVAELPDGAEDGGRLTWPEFLGERMSHRHALLAGYLPEEDGQLVERLARAAHRREEGPLYLLHGDCGAHNFLFEPSSGGEPTEVGPLAAVIDPDPMVGYPVFDLAFAFVSWPNGLEPEAILPAAEALLAAGRWRPRSDWRRILWEEVAIALYMRMGTCLMHHPRDLPAYLESWKRWRGMVD